MGCQQSDEQPLRWQIAASGTLFRTTLRFEDGYRPQLQQAGTSLSLTRFLDQGWSLRISGGAMPWGELGEHDLGLGWQGGLQVAWRWREALGWAPSMDFSLGLAVGSTPGGQATALRMLATDLRLGAAVGWSIAGVWSPYLALQLFGGPVFLDLDGVQTMGSDVHHYRASVGSSFFIGERLSLFVDFAPLGEQGLSGGLGLAF